MKKKEMDVVFILDKSGSMHGSERDTIGGYNSYINSNKDKNYFITTILFSDRMTTVTERTSIKEVKELTEKDYITGGCTALYDAVGETIDSLDKHKAEKVLFVITTDGEENASEKFNKKDIIKKIKKHDKWEFMYLGADIDSFANGGSIGIKKSRIANFSKNKVGIGSTFKALDRLTECMFMEDAIPDNWSDDIK